MLAVNAFHFVSISFWASCSFLTTKPDTSFCLHCKHTPQHPTASGNTPFHFASSFIPFTPSPFPTHFQWYIFIFCVVFAPKTNFLNFPHRPLVVAVISGNRVLLPVLAVGAFIPSPFRSGNYVRTSLRTPTLHFAFFHASTSAPHGISIPFLTPYIPFPQSYPCQFSTHFQRLPFFLRRVSPNKMNPFGFFNELWFLIRHFSVPSSSPMSKKIKIQQGLFEYNIYQQKNKKSSKDKAASTDPRFGQ